MFMQRGVRAALLSICSLLLSTPAPPVTLPLDLGPTRAALHAESIPLDSSDPARRDLGSLRFLGGWVLTSDHRGFGSISAMSIADDRVTALTDAGTLLHIPLMATRHGSVLLTGLRGTPGDPTRKVNRDTEAMAVFGDHAWVAFENRNQIWRYHLPDWRAVARAAPRAMRGWPANLGAEAMVRLPDGRFLVMSEHRGDDDTSPAVLFSGDPTAPGVRAAALRYRPPQGYRITDAALLPDGRLLLLNRRFTLLGGVSAKLTIASPATARRGAVMDGEEIARFAPPIATDNYEALAITQERGRTIIWIASDDNFNPFQRTLLLRFEWRG